MMFKNVIKKIAPPLIIDLINIFRPNRNNDSPWSGDYKYWENALSVCEGYNSKTILEKCKNALLKVKNNEVIYERDSVLFDKILYSFPLLALLQHVAIENEGNLCVLDFGGSLGSSYYQNRFFLKNIQNVKWCIIEQQNFVRCGKQYFEDSQLHFYYTIEDCLMENQPNVLLLSGVLQYTEEPEKWIHKFLTINLPYIIIDRTTFVEDERAILTVQNVPSHIYTASYPCWFFNFESFIAHFIKNYSILSIFESFADSPILLNKNKRASWKGILLKKK